MPQVTVGSMSAASMFTMVIELCVVVACKALPTLHGCVPFRALWGVGAAFEVGESRFSGLT